MKKKSRPSAPKIGPTVRDFRESLDSEDRTLKGLTSLDVANWEFIWATVRSRFREMTPDALANLVADVTIENGFLLQEVWGMTLPEFADAIKASNTDNDRSGNTKAVKRATPPKKRGPKRTRNAKADQRIFDAWKNGSGQYKDLYELADAFNMTHKEVTKALSSVRWHKRKKK